MKRGDCAMVWKNLIITSGDEMLVIFGEIFGMVAVTFGKYAKSGVFVGVKMFAAGG
jgi:hypothetical protein